MKFGSVPNPEEIDFKLPPDHPDTKTSLAKSKEKQFRAYVGCAKWNKADLKNFYPKGTKDELKYYATQFNCIELNASFYRLFPAEQYTKWKESTPKGFKFFPKFGQEISHWARLKETDELVDKFIFHISHLGDRLGVPFLQMHDNFSPKDFDKLKAFIKHLPKNYPVAIELRHTDWYNNKEIAEELYALLEKHQLINVLVDTAGRRDLMHMRLTSQTAFVRYVGANTDSDYTRLDTWVSRIAKWKEQGMHTLYFFIHQNVEEASPLLAAHFIEKLNKKIGTDLTIPHKVLLLL